MSTVAPAPIRALALAAAALLLAGCTTTYDVTVNSISHPTKPSGTSYRIAEPRSGGNAEDDLRHQEAVAHVKTALSGKGLYEAPDPAKADMVIEVDYGMEPPRVIYETRSDPVIATVGGGTSSIMVPVTDSQGRVTYQRITVYNPPRTEIVGFEEKVIPVTVYEKYLRVSARENKAFDGDAPAEQLWSVHVTAEDESKDLRGYLPVLAAASIDHIGTNTGKDKKVTVKANSDDVAFVKKGM